MARYVLLKREEHTLLTIDIMPRYQNLGSDSRHYLFVGIRQDNHMQLWNMVTFDPS